MITCTRCGKKNRDFEQNCTKCSHKLQSGFGRIGDSSLSTKKNKDLFNLSLKNSNDFTKEGEAWVYALFLLGAVIFFTYQQVYWPLYVLTPLVGLVAWFRKI